MDPTVSSMTYSFRLSNCCEKMGTTQGPAMARPSSLSPSWVPSPAVKSCWSDAKYCNSTRHSSALCASSSVACGNYSSGSGELVDSRKEGRMRRKIAGIDQEELADPHVLADSDSCFCELNGVGFQKHFGPRCPINDTSSKN